MEFCILSGMSYRKKRTALVLFLLSSIVPATAELVVDHAWFCADKPVPIKYKWWEGFGEFFPDHSRLAGTFHVYLENRGEDPVQISDIALDGVPLETLHYDLRVGWWRTLPNPVPPGDIAEVTIRLKYPLEGETHALTFETEDGTVRADVPMQPHRMEIAYAAFSPDLDRVFVYVEKYTDKDMKLSRVHVDGRDVTRKTSFHQRNYFRNLALVEIELSPPLREGDRPVIKVSSKQGDVAEAMVRAWPSDFFMLGAFGLHDSMQRYPDLNLNTCLTFAGDIHPYYLELLGEAGYKALPGGDTDANYYYETKDIDSVNAYFFFDEPDGKDYPGNLPPTAEVAKFRRLGEMDGLGSMAQLMVDYTRRIQHIAPDKGTFMIVNQTYKPDQYWMYGKIPDFTAPDVYPHTTGEDPYMIYQAMTTSRIAAMPRPMISVPDFVQQAFSRFYWERTVDPEELDLRVLYTIAAGGKGVIWYAFDGSLQWTPETEQRMAWMNGRLEIAGPVLEAGHPVPEEWASSNRNELMLRTLLCGNDTVVVTMINTNYQATGEGFSFEPIPDATVRVELPRSMNIKHCFAMDPDRSRDFPFARDGNAIVIDAGDVDIGDFLVCTGNSRLDASLRGRFDSLVEHRLAVRDRMKAETDRKLAAIHDERFRIDASSKTNAYGIADSGLWNPTGIAENAIEWRAEKQGEKKGAAWTFDIDAADEPHQIGIHLRGRVERSGANVFDTYLRNAAGKLIATDSIEVGNVHGSGAFGEYAPIIFPFEWTVNFPEPGEYTLDIRQGKQRHRWFPSTARVSRYIYVKPAG